MKIELPQCAICQSTCKIPVKICEAHMFCHQCVNQYVMNKCKWMRGSKYLFCRQVRMTCPICKKGNVGTLAHVEKKVPQHYALTGLHHVANSLLSVIYHGNRHQCPYCDRRKMNIGQAVRHVDTCGMRPVKCLHCSKCIPIQKGLKHHVTKFCTQVKCRHCSFKGRFVEIIKHEHCHKKFKEAANLLISLGEHMYTRTPKIHRHSEESLNTFISFFKPFLLSNEPNTVIQTIHELTCADTSDTESTTSTTSDSGEEEQEQELQHLIVIQPSIPPHVETSPLPLPTQIDLTSEEDEQGPLFRRLSSISS